MAEISKSGLEGLVDKLIQDFDVCEEDRKKAVSALEFSEGEKKDRVEKIIKFYGTENTKDNKTLTWALNSLYGYLTKEYNLLQNERKEYGKEYRIEDKEKYIWNLFLILKIKYNSRKINRYARGLATISYKLSNNVASKDTKIQLLAYSLIIRAKTEYELSLENQNANDRASMVKFKNTADYFCKELENFGNRAPSEKTLRFLKKYRDNIEIKKLPEEMMGAAEKILKCIEDVLRKP